MTRKQAVKKLEAYIKCWDQSLSGKCSDYGYDCGNCKLGQAQGNKLEINECLKIAYDALQEVIATEDFTKTGSLDRFNEAMELINKYKGR